MKPVNFLKALGAVACVVVACNGYAQSSDAMAASGTMAAPHGKTTKADRALDQAVRKALAKGKIDVSSVVVRSHGGAVTLTGAVPQSDQIDQATTVAQGVQGVTSVNNKLTLPLK